MNIHFSRLLRSFKSWLGAGLLTACTASSLATSVSYTPQFPAGWNLAGNSSNVALDVKASFASQPAVQSVWKWNPAGSNWSFYAPSLDNAGTLAAYATAKGYAVLTAIGPGQGYWVNAQSVVTLAAQSGSGFSLAASDLTTGWNLAGTADDVAPGPFSSALGNVISLWAWDNTPGQSGWYFYAPALAGDGTLASYIQGKGYKAFGTNTLGNGRGFWVNYAGTGGVSTTVSGVVVKGPVSGAQVCAYTVAGSARGTPLGSCTPTDASGNYSFAVPAGTGPLWMEATGGTYTDEVTGIATTLPVGSPLRSIVTANAGTVTTMLTPLTTMALNAAAATVGSGGTLNTAAFNTAAAQLLNTFNLPSTLNITATVPAFGTGINSYGTALTVISQVVANGTALAAILANSNPQALASAFATAATPPVTPPTSGSPTASGTLTVSGATATNAASSLTPRADGFEVKIDQNAVTSYRFASAANGSPSQVDVTVNVGVNGAITVAYFDVASRTSGFCSANCGVTVTPASGATHPVTVSFSNTPMGGNLRLNGSLVGDAPGAAWVPADLAGATTSSSLTLAGTAVRAVSGSDSTIDMGGGNSIRSIAVRLSDGSTLSFSSQTGIAGFTVSRIAAATQQTCIAACNTTMVDTTGSTRVTFANTTLGNGGPVLNGTVDIARTSGSLTTNDTGGFTPVASNIESLNSKRTLTFSVLGTAAQAGLSLVTVDVVGGRVVLAQATVGIGTQVLSCFDNGAAIGVPACTGVSVAADGRTVTFTNAVLRGGGVGQPARNVTFNGTVVAKGP